MSFSVSSDGSARFGVNSQLAMTKQRPTVVQMMGFHSIEHGVSATRPDSLSAVANSSVSSGWLGSVDRVNISTECIVDMQHDIPLATKSKGGGLQALDVCMLSDCVALVAYGGSAGIVRIECRDLRKSVE